MSLVLPTTAPLGVESLAAVPLLTWLLAISPVVLLLVLVLWGRFSTIVNAGVTVVYSAAVALVAFGAGSLTIAVSLGKGAWWGCGSSTSSGRRCSCATSRPGWAWPRSVARCPRCCTAQ